MLQTLILGSTFVNAQKVDLDPWRYTVSFRQLPKQPLPESWKTYSVTVSAAGSVRNNFSDFQIAGMVRIDGLKPLEKGGHLIVDVSLGDLIIYETKVSERVEEQKDKDGKVTGRKYFYKPVVAYGFSASSSWRGYNGENAGSLVLVNNNSRFTWEGVESTSSEVARDYINNNRQTLRDGFTRERVKDALGNLSAQLTFNYGYQAVRGNDLVYLLDSKKHPEYEGHQKVVTFVKEVLGKMSADEPLDKIKEQAKPIQEYLEGTLKKYTKDEKGDRKMRYAAYYALAQIAYWLDDPESCIKYSEALIANEYDEKDGKRLIEAANYLKDLFAKNKTNTRHFPIDVSNYKGVE